MSLALIPQPKKCKNIQGYCILPSRLSIGVPDYKWVGAARLVQDHLAGSRILAAASGVSYEILFVKNAKLEVEGYRLGIGGSKKQHVIIEAATQRGAFWGAQTFVQILRQSAGGKMPCMQIDDSPDFADRGFYYDVARGRVPTRSRFEEMIRLLSSYKINHLQLYIEHTFSFRAHPSIGNGANPLTAEDILALDDYAAKYMIELVPSLSTFGHLASVLKHPEFHHLAEDFGKGNYHETDGMSEHALNNIGWSLSPANPKSYEFLDSLFAEFLPLFRSNRFNVCCDETYDLGCGQSYALAQKIGKGELYVRHLLRLYELCGKYGKRMMFWGDIIRKYPELIIKLPKDVIVLDWGYDYNHRFSTIKDFAKSKLPFMACPSTSSYVAFFPRIPQSRANIHGFADAAKKNAALGILNTEWGDRGHFNFMECSWTETAYGAEHSWNTGAELTHFTERFAGEFLKLGKGAAAAAKAIDRLGEISFHSTPGFYQSVWYHLFFEKSNSVLFQKQEFIHKVCRAGVISEKEFVLDEGFARGVMKELGGIIQVMKGWKKIKGADPHQVLDYWIFAAECISFAAEKLAVLTSDTENTLKKRRNLAAVQTKLMRRFQSLWLARNHRSEIFQTLKRYRASIRDLTRFLL